MEMEGYLGELEAEFRRSGPGHVPAGSRELPDDCTLGQKYLHRI